MTHETDAAPPPPPPQQPQPSQPIDMKTWAIILYSLSLAGVVTGGITSLVALIIGYVKRDEAAGTPYASHFEFSNLTNLWGLLAGIGIFVVGTILVFLIIGIFLMPLAYVLLGAWYLVRMVIGLVRLLDNKPIDNPRTLLI